MLSPDPMCSTTPPGRDPMHLGRELAVGYGSPATLGVRADGGAQDLARLGAETTPRRPLGEVAAEKAALPVRARPL
jgi:hypothetical protein